MAHIEVPPIEIDLNDFLITNINHTFNNNIATEISSFSNPNENIEINVSSNTLSRIVSLDTAVQVSNNQVHLDMNVTEEE